MTQRDHSKIVNETQLHSYLTAETSADRILVLNKWKKDLYYLDDTIARGLLKLPLPCDEAIAILEICFPHNKANFEIWVMENLLSFEQSVAAAAIRSWAKHSDAILWHSLIPIAQLPDLPQRVRYTILDIAPATHGYEIVKAVLASPGWEDLSSAFHSLAFERSLQYGIYSTRLQTLGWKIANESNSHSYPENKALWPALVWLCKYDFKELQSWYRKAPSHIWITAFDSVIDAHSSAESSWSKIEKLLQKGRSVADLIPSFPPLWSRERMSPIICQHIFNSQDSVFFNFDGVPQATLLQALTTAQISASNCEVLLRHLPFSDREHFGNRKSLHFGNSYRDDQFPDLNHARSLACDGKAGIASNKITKAFMFSKEPFQDRQTFYSSADFLNDIYNNSLRPHPKTIWDQLNNAFADPMGCDLSQITVATRKYKGIVSLAHICLMSLMKGKDEAVLKLLDHIRSEDECELKAVVKALSQINTPRSNLELIAMITRPNSTIAIKQDITSILASKDLSALQHELRSAVQDLVLPTHANDPIFQIKDDLSALLISKEIPETRSTPSKHKGNHNSSNDFNLDRELAGMIPHYQNLSSEIKRALRTALFFHKTIEHSEHINSIDLSPLIDMQYKAMELLYREFFEDHVSHSLAKGVIQRKLDVIGYARPIVRQMDDFEAYIAALPVVRDIPFFSKFKLRKMLRAICQFEPGRRFTLDGLKAFGLYFLVFGRQQCQFGLAQTYPLGANSDADLAQFCKELHVFQDFRNRAAHEGFHPDASNDVLGIWRTTASVVQWAFTIKEAQKSHNSSILQSKAS